MKNMNLKLMIEIEVQNPFDFTSVPDNKELQSWVEASIQDDFNEAGEVLSMVVRFVDEEEGLSLNQTYRNKKSATNVLSFPFEIPDIPELIDESSLAQHLGDLVLCEPVVVKEAQQQIKRLQQHWAHLLIHGTLHLQGFDHQNDTDATAMESLEVKILKNLGFDNPY